MHILIGKEKLKNTIECCPIQHLSLLKGDFHVEVNRLLTNVNRTHGKTQHTLKWPPKGVRWVPTSPSWSSYTHQTQSKGLELHEDQGYGARVLLLHRPLLHTSHVVLCAHHAIMCKVRRGSGGPWPLYVVWLCERFFSLLLTHPSSSRSGNLETRSTTTSLRKTSDSSETNKY